MSISLDLALYLREQRHHHDISLAERGVLFTLMFRVGSNPFSWVSQEDLAIELDISERHLKRYMSSLLKKNLIVIEKDSKDLRKNTYRPAEFLINYHQKQDRKAAKKYPKKLSTAQANREKKGTSLSPNLQNRGHLCHLNRGHLCHLILDEKNPQDLQSQGLQGSDSLPKVKYKNNSIKETYMYTHDKKRRAHTFSSVPKNFQPNSEHQQISDDLKLDLQRQAALFVDHYEATGKKMQDWNAAFRSWLRKATMFKNEPRTYSQKDTQTRSTVPYFKTDDTDKFVRTPEKRALAAQFLKKIRHEAHV